MVKLISSRKLKSAIKERHKDYYVLTGGRITDKKSYDLAIFLSQQREKLARSMKKHRK